MFVEFCLDPYSEDPVNLLVVRLVEKNKDRGLQDSTDPGEDVYYVEHILEARGSREVKQIMEIHVPSEYTGTNADACFVTIDGPVVRSGTTVYWTDANNAAHVEKFKDVSSAIKFYESLCDNE